MNVRNQKGAIFVLSLLVMMVLVVLSSVFIYRAVTEKNVSDRERKLTQALFIGESGAFVGMSTFGASAPAERLYKEFGITPEAVAAAAKAKL